MWGYDFYGQTSGPNEADGTYQAVAAGLYHTVAIKTPTAAQVKGKLITDDNGQQYRLFISPYDPNFRVVIPVSGKQQ